jgi:hypothetical protein
VTASELWRLRRVAVHKIVDAHDGVQTRPVATVDG